jgi:hypothetical protein
MSQAPSSRNNPANALASAVGNTGLCITCRFAADCGPAKFLGGPILFCEEFETAATPTARKVSSRSPQVPSEEDAGEKQKGLCMDCTNRENCTFPRPEGGVWHCEEYL